MDVSWCLRVVSMLVFHKIFFFIEVYLGEWHLYFEQSQSKTIKVPIIFNCEDKVEYFKPKTYAKDFDVVSVSHPQITYFCHLFIIWPKVNLFCMLIHASLFGREGTHFNMLTTTTILGLKEEEVVTAQFFLTKHYFCTKIFQKIKNSKIFIRHHYEMCHPCVASHQVLNALTNFSKKIFLHNLPGIDFVSHIV